LPDPPIFRGARHAGAGRTAGSAEQPRAGLNGPVHDDTDADADPAAAGAETDAATRRRINRQAASIVASVAPFGLVFGAAAATAGLSLLEAMGYSLFVFAGSSQFAAVEILGDGGSVASAAIAGLLLNVRSLAFGVVMAPALAGAWWKRAANGR